MQTMNTYRRIQTGTLFATCNPGRFARAFSRLSGHLVWSRFLLALTTASLLLVQWGCSKDVTAVDATNQALTLSLSGEPPQLDSTKATDQVSGMVLGHVMEGLMRYDASQRLQYGVASHYELTGNGIRFELKRNAFWSDGVPVTAHDFQFAWRRAVAPDNASEYAFLLYSIKNAEAINNGKLPPEALGVQVIDDYTLEIEYRSPQPHFLKLLAFPTYFPVRQDFYQSHAGRYGADADDLLYNGPFRITEWAHGARLTVEFNPHYWDKDNIHLKKIDWRFFTSDANAILNLFRDGAIAIADNLSSESLNIALEQRWRMRKFADGSVFYLSFNFRPGRLTGNTNLRRALHLSFDPYELVNLVMGVPGNLPGLSLFPTWLLGQNLPFRVEHPLAPHKPDRKLALEHLARAKAELGVSELPPLTLLIGDTPSARKEAEYFQGLFFRKLGIRLKIDAQIFKQRLAKMTSGDYDIVAAGWGPDYDDPLTFGDLFSSWNLNNRGRYSNPEVDRQVRIAESSQDPAARMNAFAVIQRILYEDTVIIPTYERGKVYVAHPQLQGMVRRIIGADPDFTRARVVPLAGSTAQ